MDDEIPPPLPSDFVHSLDHSRNHADDDENESFGHIPLPEIDHSELSIPEIPYIPPLVPKLQIINGITIDTVKPQVEEAIAGKPLPETFNSNKTPEETTDKKDGHLSNGYNAKEDFRSPNAFEDPLKEIQSGPLELLPKEATTAVSPNPPSPLPAETVDSDGGDDEFGDFTVTEDTPEISQQAAPVANTSRQDNNEDDEWGEFDKVPRRDSHLASQASVDEDEGDFGAFGESQIAVEESKTAVGKSWTPEFKESPRVDDENWEEDLLKQIVDTEWDNFTDEEKQCFEEDDITELSSVLNAPMERKFGPDIVLRKSFELWCLLRIVEEAKSLQYIFEGSTLATNHYKKINIDKSSVGKGVLQPISLDTAVTPLTVNGNAIKPSDTLEVLTPSPIFTEKEPPPSPSTSTIAFDSLSAPPAEFDWDKSGLTNPLKGTKGSSALLDVDFLSANTGASSSGAFTLQKDLAAFGLDAPSDISQRRTPNMSIYDTILSSNTPQTSYRPVSELSLDARALHDQLPDLSCLLSTKVMLPFGGQ